MVIVTGSLAFDHILDFPGNFSDYIIPDKVHKLNLSFLVESLRKERGGCAANIAYNLALLGEKPVIFATAGEDFTDYKRWLAEVGIDVRFIREIHNETTAVGFGISDNQDNQIWGYYPGAMRNAKDLKLEEIFELVKETDLGTRALGKPRSLTPRFKSLGGSNLKSPFLQRGQTGQDEENEEFKAPKIDNSKVGLVMIAPNDPEAMIGLVKESKQHHLPYIFDPGMQIPRLNKEDLLKAVDGAKVLIGNDYEIDLIERMLGAQKQHLLKLAEQLIVTQGPKGSKIFTPSGEIEIPPVVPKKVVDPIGAGDAYRAGIIYGLINRLPWEIAGRMGSLLATYTVEEFGTTTHQFKIIEFKKRYLESFGQRLEL